MMEIKRDNYGIIGQPDDKYMFSIEGGDSMNWQAHYYFLTNAVGDVSKYTHYFEPLYGLYVRHPNPHQSIYGWASYCEGNWKGVESRDQMTGKLCFFAKAKARGPLWRCFKKHLQRGLIFANNTIHNGDNPKKYKDAWTHSTPRFARPVTRKKHKLPDITGPDIWALYIRGFRAWWLYPLLVLLDFQLLLTAVTKYFKNDNDILSFFIKVTTAREIMPTPFAWLASKVSTQRNILLKLEEYWCGWRKQPSMVLLYVPYVEKYWRG